MKKPAIAALAVGLLILIPLMFIGFLASNQNSFKIPHRFEKIKIDMNEKVRTEEVVYKKMLKAATRVDIMVQCDVDSNSSISIISDKKIIGSNVNKLNYQINKLTGNSSMSMSLILQPGNYSISISNNKTKGSIMIGYEEKKMSTSEYERLKRIDSGELDNPPKGYENIYSADLTGLNTKQKSVYTLTLDRMQKIGISVYTNATKGDMTVDFIGNYNNNTGLVFANTNHICDQLITTLPKGTYEFKLTSDDADGQVSIFIKK